MWKVIVPCERMEERSETEVCTEGGCERGRGEYGCRMVTAAAEGGMGGGGCMHRVLVKEREGLLADGVRVRIGEKFTPEVTGEACEVLEPKETGRLGQPGWTC